MNALIIVLEFGNDPFLFQKSLQDQLPEELRRRLLHYRCRPSQEMLNTGVNVSLYLSASYLKLKT